MNDSAFEQLRLANPVPDPAAIRRHTAEEIRETIERGSRTMTTETKTRVGPMAQSPRRWVTAFAAAAAVVVVVAGPMMLGAGPAGWIALLEPEPTEIGLAYMEARQDRDLDRMLGLLADDVELLDTPVVASPGELDSLFRFSDILAAQFVEPSCREIGLDSGIVQCSYLFESALLDVVHLEPLPGSFNLVVEDGMITRVVHNFNVFDFQPAWDGLIDWIRERDPSATDRLIGSVAVDGATGRVMTPMLTDSALDEWATLVAAYLADRG